MNISKPGPDADLGVFLEEAGKSLWEAQRALSPEQGAFSAGMAISEVNLEIKTAVQPTAKGGFALQPISRQALTSGLDAAAISTLRVHYVAVAQEAEGGGAPPSKSRSDIIDGVKKRDDVVRLAKILGNLEVEPVYVASSRKWLVNVTDPAGHTVREIVIPDKAEER